MTEQPVDFQERMQRAIEQKDAAKRTGVMDNWEEKLQRNKKQLPLATLDNAIIILANDIKLAGAIMRNAFTARDILLNKLPNGSTEQEGPFPRDWNDADIGILQAYLERHYSPRFTFITAKRALMVVAQGRSFHPVTDWLNTLTWDGVDRIDTWLVTAFGALDCPYIREIGAKFLIAAVRRVRQPGSQFDYIPILEGAQDIGKSRCCQALFGEWFTDQLPASLKDKDCNLAMLGVWGIELAEIEHILKNDVDIVKAFISRRADRFRPPYGHGIILQPRQCVFIGTTNRNDYLRDDSGNRRFWPITCRRADFDWVVANRDQLWAEAAEREAAGEKIWLQENKVVRIALEAQAARMVEDPWQNDVLKAVGPLKKISTRDILEAMKIPLERRDRVVANRIGGVLRAAGWSRASVREGKNVKKLWVLKRDLRKP
jgi:putative DNA primase/helicase